MLFWQHFGLKVFFTCIFIVLLFSKILELSFSDFVIVVFTRFIGGGCWRWHQCALYVLHNPNAPNKQKIPTLSYQHRTYKIGSALSHFIVAYFSMSDYPHLMNFFEIGFCLNAFCIFLLIELPPSHVAKAFFLKILRLFYLCLAQHFVVLFLAQGMLYGGIIIAQPMAYVLVLRLLGYFLSQSFLKSVHLFT